MNSTEAAALLAHCSGFDNRQPSVAAAQSWAAALHDVPFDQEARDAVAVYYSTPPQDPRERLWILPHHVRALRTKLRSQRLEHFQYEPQPDETVRAYLARYRGQVQAIASGAVAPPNGRLALTGSPHRDVAAALAGVGRPVPGDDGPDLAETVRRAGPLGVVCPTCAAAIGRPCKTPGGGDRHPLGTPRGRPHSARRRAAQGQPELTPEDRAAQEQRIRAASAAALARLQQQETA